MRAAAYTDLCLGYNGLYDNNYLTGVLHPRRPGCLMTQSKGSECVSVLLSGSAVLPPVTQRPSMALDMFHCLPSPLVAGVALRLALLSLPWGSKAGSWRAVKHFLVCPTDTMVHCHTLNVPVAQKLGQRDRSKCLKCAGKMPLQTNSMPRLPLTT